MSCKAGIWDWTNSGALTEAWEALLGDHVPFPTSCSFLTESSSAFTGNKKGRRPQPKLSCRVNHVGMPGSGGELWFLEDKPTLAPQPLHR